MSAQYTSIKANVTSMDEMEEPTHKTQDTSADKGAKKAPGAFLTISEVSDVLDVHHHVLRFWETKFTQVKPLKRGGGRRYYRPEDVEVLKRIHYLLYTDKYTIKGAQNLLKGKSKQQIIQGAEGNAPVAATPQASNDVYSQTKHAPDPAQDDKYKSFLKELLTDLKELRDIVDTDK